MAICGNCKTETPRVRVRLGLHGESLPDQCPQCAPQEFEGKVTAPSDKKIWMGYEAHPNEYEKRYDKDGVIMVRKSEYRHEQETRLALGATDEREAQEIAEHKKRLERRTDPMSADQHLAAIQKAKLISDAMAESAAQAEQQTRQAELDSWLIKSTG